MNSCINMNADFFGMQGGQQISWSPTLDNLVTASGSPGFTFETCFCKVIIVKALLSDNFVPFAKTDVLETLTSKVEQWWTIFREKKEVLGLKLFLFGRNVSGTTQMVMLCTKHMAFQKNIRV